MRPVDYPEHRAYEIHRQPQLAQWKKHLAALRASAALVSPGSHSPFQRSIHAFQCRFDHASHLLSSLKGASDEDWERVRRNLDSKWMEAGSQFKNPSAAL